MTNAYDGFVPEPPKLDKKWLARWRHTWGVRIRKPTKRYKVKRSILKQRLKVFWSNVLAVRWFMSLVWQKEPIQEQYDQEGVHFNEPGSKQTGTYEIPGRIDPPVRENHGQTRERISWMTATWSNLAEAGRRIPLEQLFKARGTRVLQALTVPEPERFTFQTSSSGSYRSEHVIEFFAPALVTVDS